MRKLKKPIKITPRTDVPTPDIWYVLEIGKRKYSLMNVGKLMSTHSFPYEGMFMGWETLRDVKGEQEIIQGKTLEELLHKLI